MRSRTRKLKNTIKYLREAQDINVQSIYAYQQKIQELKRQNEGLQKALSDLKLDKLKLLQRLKKEGKTICG